MAWMGDRPRWPGWMRRRVPHPEAECRQIATAKSGHAGYSFGRTARRGARLAGKGGERDRKSRAERPPPGGHGSATTLQSSSGHTQRAGRSTTSALAGTYAHSVEGWSGAVVAGGYTGRRAVCTGDQWGQASEASSYH